MVQLPQSLPTTPLPRAIATAKDKVLGGGPVGTIASVAAHEVGGALRRRGKKPSLPSPSSIKPVRETVPVDPRKNAAFSRGVEAVPGNHAHSGFLHALTFPVSMSLLTSKDFPLPVLGLVHLKNTVTQRTAVPVGETVVIRSRIREFGHHRRGVTVTVVSEIWVEGGELAVTDESLYLAKVATGDSTGSTEASSGGGSTRDGEKSPRRREDPREGARLIARWVLGSDTGRRYAAVSGDANPIHLSAASAKVFGMRSSIAHGMYCASRALGTVAEDPTAPGTWSVSFAAPVYLPATVMIWRVMGEANDAVTTVRGVNPKGALNFELSVRP